MGLIKMNIFCLIFFYKSIDFNKFIYNLNIFIFSFFEKKFILRFLIITIEFLYFL
jgi:hypothetical protein